MKKFLMILFFSMITVSAMQATSLVLRNNTNVDVQGVIFSRPGGYKKKFTLSTGKTHYFRYLPSSANTIDVQQKGPQVKGKTKPTQLTIPHRLRGKKLTIDINKKGKDQLALALS